MQSYAGHLREAFLRPQAIQGASLANGGAVTGGVEDADDVSDDESEDKSAPEDASRR